MLNSIGKINYMFPLVGGNWNNGSYSGVFNRNWNNYRTNTNNNVGFRVSCSDSGFFPEIPKWKYWNQRDYSFQSVINLLVKSAIHRLSSILYWRKSVDA